MTSITLLLLIGSLMTINALTDSEIEKIKGLVDKELVQRELDLVKEKEDKNKPKNEIVHPLGGRTKTTVNPAGLKKQKTTRHPDTNLQESIDNCIDIYDTHKCQLLIREGMDCNKDDMHLLCEKSCKYCGNHQYPGDCKLTEHGCCSDNITPKTDPWGHNCPTCKDSVAELCEPHVNDCNEVGMVGNWMRTNCKKTCEVCTPEPEEGHNGNVIDKCLDDEKQKAFCPSWKEAGLCTEIPGLMMKHCKRTCKLCKKYRKKY